MQKTSQNQPSSKLAEQLAGTDMEDTMSRLISIEKLAIELNELQ